MASPTDGATAERPEPEDPHFMAMALALARRGLGRVAPNPAVGCVIVAEGRVVGRGWTQPGGRPHAETEALARAGAAARGGTAYVSLEPCAHHGRTPPCAEALVEAGIARVVTALRDPDPRVDGGGIARLREAGLRVTEGVGAVAAAAVNRGFLARIREGRPYVALKLASSLDGRIATPGGESRWITGPESRAWAHGLRARYDAIMVGSGTALADDPDLGCRLPGLADRSPVRIVVDRRLRLPLTSRLVATAATRPTWLVTAPGNDRTRLDGYRQAGVEVIETGDGHAELPSPAAVLAALAERGITRVLVEGGAHLAAALIGAHLVDRIYWFQAPFVIGGDGHPAVAGLALERLAEAFNLPLARQLRLGVDTLGIFDAMGLADVP